MPNQKVGLLTDTSAEMSAAPLQNLLDLAIPAMIIISIFAAFFLSIYTNAFQPLFYYAKSAQWARFVIRPAVIWGMMGSLLLIFRTLLWFRYKPFAPAEIEEAPGLTVIIPAYNEGRMVEKSNVQGSEELVSFRGLDGLG